MKKFTLLINSQDLDTGNYEYFPYTDKKISDFETTFRVLTRLKTGKLTEDSEEVNKYIFAKYCVNKEDTNLKAIEAAYKASGKYRYLPVAKRKKMFKDILLLLKKHRKEVIDLLIIEGHPQKLAEWEVEGMSRGGENETINFYRQQIWKTVGKEGKEWLYLVRKPDGVVCVVPPRNAPASNSFIAVSSLFAGNCLIIKPPLKNPLSTIYVWKEIVCKAALDNGAPEGVINIVAGNSKKIMDEWLASPYVNDVVYFGESDTGIEMGNRIYQSGKKPILELSGNDMLFVWKDADINGAVESFMDAFLGSTQICMVPKGAIVHPAVFDRFLSTVIKEVKKLKVGLPTSPEVCLTPVGKIKEFYDFLNDALSKGGKLACGGERVNHEGVEDKNGVFIKPAIIQIDDFEKGTTMLCVNEENFFPLIPILKVDGNSDEEIFEKMLTLANTNAYGLRTSVWVKSRLFMRRFVKRINNSGLLRINCRHVGFSLYLATHGGTGKSGGPYGELNYLAEKTTHLQGITIVR